VLNGCVCVIMCLQCFDTVGWGGGRKGIQPVKSEWWDAVVVICLEQGEDLQMAQLMHCHSLSLASVKSRLVLPFWYRLTWVVPDKWPLNGCVCVIKVKRLDNHFSG